MKNFKVTALALMAMTATAANAQDKVEAEISADVVSSYVWRGAKIDDAAVQPTLGVSYKGLSLSAWGSYGIVGGKNSDITKELDLTLAYSTGNFNVGITDYWSTTDDDTKYFMYEAHKTSHVFEGNIGYDFGPVSLQWFTNFAGADYNREDGSFSYSSYVELAAPFKLGGLDWNAAVGAVPFKANESCYDANSKGFAVTNVSLKASKDIKITDSFSIPLFGQIATNPSTQKAYFVVGFTLAPNL